MKCGDRVVDTKYPNRVGDLQGYCNVDNSRVAIVWFDGAIGIEHVPAWRVLGEPLTDGVRLKAKERAERRRARLIVKISQVTGWQPEDIAWRSESCGLTLKEVLEAVS